MNASIVLYAGRIPRFSEPGFREFAPSLSGMVSAARRAGADAVTLWVLCPSEGAAGRCRETVLGEAEKLHADVLFALCPAFFEKPTARPSKAAEPLFSLFSGERSELVLFEDGIRSRELALRLAFDAQGACMTEVRGFERGETLSLRRSSYNANLAAVLELPLPTAERPGVFTVVPGDFPPVSETDEPAAFAPKIRRVELSWDTDAKEAESSAALLPAKVETGLKSAKRVVICGHGMGSAEKTQSARNLTKALSASLGGTRPAAIDGWIDHSQLVGISGSFIKPEVCIVLGASGARAFAAGIRESGLMIAVNTDEKAAIFRMCDAGAVCDCAEFAQELARLIEANTANT